MKYAILPFLFSLVIIRSTAQTNTSSDRIGAGFSFVFMTDIHIKPEVSKMFEAVIDSVNHLKPDFVMTGGDLVYDVMRGNVPRSDSLFQLYKKLTRGFNMPVHNCIGNHELFGIYPESDIDSTHSDYKYGMFERYFGKTYYSFNHKGWHFIVLNSIDVISGKRYIGIIDEKQKQWIKDDLAKVGFTTPVVVTLHIPLISTFHQRYPATTPQPEPNGVLVSNRKEVLDLFNQHNLKLVLQGHLHWIEDVHLDNKTHFVTAGSVAGRPSWQDTRHGERGFMQFTVKGGNVSWKYIECLTEK